MKHLYYLSDDELFARWPGLRTGSIDRSLIGHEQRRYREQACESVEADVLVLGPRDGPYECTKRDRTPWQPGEFAGQLRQHLRVLCPPKKKKRRAVIDSDSEEPGHTPFVATEAEDVDGGEDMNSEEEEEDEVDEYGNLRGFVVPDGMESEPSSTPSSRPGASSNASSPAVAIVGSRSRTERDADGIANAINLVTPPHA